MFEDREPSIFPHPLSAWWIPIFVGLIFGTGFAIDIFFPNDEGMTAAFVPLAFLLSLVVLVVLSIQMFRLLMYFVNRVPSAKSKIANKLGILDKQIGTTHPFAARDVVPRLRFGQVYLGEAKHFLHNRNASVAALR